MKDEIIYGMGFALHLILISYYFKFTLVWYILQCTSISEFKGFHFLTVKAENSIKIFLLLTKTILQASIIVCLFFKVEIKQYVLEIIQINYRT